MENVHNYERMPKVMSLESLKEITNNFSNEHKIASGTFGTVYKGEQNGEVIAVKLLRIAPGHDDLKQFLSEFENLSRLTHPNIVKLLGYCYEIKHEFLEFDRRLVPAENIYRALCFEYMHGGSLGNHLYAVHSGHNWQTRYKIIKGTCEGLKYLHEELECPMYHLDLKPENILLDKNMVPKLADFGLSRLVSDKSTNSTKSAIGTTGYLPPEYIEKNLVSNKFDIFSLGVVIIRIITGYYGYQKSAEMSSQEFIEHVLDNWRNRLRVTPETISLDAECNQVKRCIEIALACVNCDRMKRPTIGGIIHMLNETEKMIKRIEACSSVPNFGNVEMLSMQLTTPPSPLQRVTTVPKGPRPREGGAEVRLFGSTAVSKLLDVHPLDLTNSERYKVDIDTMRRKIHRYPASIEALCLSERYTVPMVVAIGPYHHGRDRLKQAEKEKQVAAYNCIRNTGYSVEQMYDTVVSVAHDVRRLYDKDVVAGISDDDFLHMMFFDACFLVQYMLSRSDYKVSAEMADSLRILFDANNNEIYHDILLLENQLPWPVVQKVMEFVSVPLEKFVDYLKGCLQDRKGPVENTSIVNYEPPHLLGLLWFYIVGENKTEPDTRPKSGSISFSVTSIELAELGIMLKPSKTTELIHMGLETKETFFPRLSLAPLPLDCASASLLINMAALELCTTPNFVDAGVEESVVCSYLLILAMLVGKKEDVQVLRRKHIIQGGRGLTDREALDFFKSIQGLRLGSCYLRLMEDIEDYRVKRRIFLNLYAFYYKLPLVAKLLILAYIYIVVFFIVAISLWAAGVFEN